MLDARKLRMLAELDRLGTIAAVARELHLTAPGVSMQLASLERELGLALTERTGRTVTLTPAGRSLARHGQEIVDRISVAELEAAALRDGSAGVYRVAAFPSAMRTIVAEAWRRARESDLGIELRAIELEPEDALAALAAGEVELAIIHSYSNVSDQPQDQRAAVRILSEPVWLAHSGREELVDLRDFSAVDWIVPGSARACYEMAERACGRAGFVPRVVAEATDFASQLALVAAGVGVALVPQLTVASLPDGVTLAALVEPVQRHLFVVSRAGVQFDPGVVRVRELLEAAAEPLRSGALSR